MGMLRHVPNFELIQRRSADAPTRSSARVAVVGVSTIVLGLTNWCFGRGAETELPWQHMSRFRRIYGRVEAMRTAPGLSV